MDKIKDSRSAINFERHLSQVNPDMAKLDHTMLLPDIHLYPAYKDTELSLNQTKIAAAVAVQTIQCKRWLVKQ